MNRSKAEAMVTRILNNAAEIQYGSVSLTANIHDGRITSVNYSTTENTRETETKEKSEEYGAQNGQ
ncbi:MAG: YezD family protein [Treponema sp.]|jgi:hypothetical protein|nr:YezD family protein [Treponema sp.]